MKLTSFAIFIIFIGLTLGHYNRMAERPSPQWVEYYKHAYDHLGNVTLKLNNVDTTRSWQFQVRVFNGRQLIQTYDTASYVNTVSSYAFDLSPTLRKLGSPRNLRIECTAPYEYYSIETK